MAARAHPQKHSQKVPVEEIQRILFSALKNGDDFVLTREPRPGEEPDPGTDPVIHILTGNLITRCRLNGLLGRAALYEDEGARAVTIREKDLVSGPEK
jgi:hypothetical protein